ncbi:anti-sigma factor family protein [Streptomyces halobius]|uniref:Zf-HC2 domain-containing protein n=1 Tax=Streptomyces halobius TaxID=2879846 RepID=A0ABY4MGZ3_9ACTN|nr:zf-HC2 domain-containing protein [Streptomyces halobius]UQA97069.1 zf-HC2 domain-containing protein [Streptomyces halobius]
MSSWLWQRRRSRRMNCMQVARVLQSYLDGESDEFTARRVAEHVEDCRRCGLEVAVYREIKHALARHDTPDAATLSRLRGFSEALMGSGPPDDQVSRTPSGDGA